MFEAVTRLFDPVPLALVIGGTFIAAALASTRDDVVRAIRALLPLFRSRPDRDARLARQAVRDIERIVELKGVGCADHVRTQSRFVRTAALQLVDAPSPEAFAAWTDTDIGERQARHEAAYRVWRLAADAAPSMGMIGTVIGLVGMFATLSDPDAMGPAMAIVMLTTLYGLFLSALICGPIAARLERLSLAEQRWQGEAATRLIALAIEGAPERRQWLKHYLRNEG